MNRNNYDQNRAYLQKAIELLRLAGPEYRLRLAETLWLLSQILDEWPDTARQVAGESVEIARQAGPAAIWHLANALSRFVTLLCYPDTPPDQGLALAQEALDLSEQAGDRWNTMPFFSLAYFNTQLGNISKAREYYLESIVRAGEAGDQATVRRVMIALSDLERAHDYRLEAFSHYQEAALAWMEWNNIGGAARCLECMAFLVIDDHQFETAALLLGKADSLRRESGQKMEGEESQEYARYLTELKSHLDADRLASAWKKGAGQNLPALFKSIAQVQVGNHPA